MYNPKYNREKFDMKIIYESDSHFCVTETIEMMFRDLIILSMYNAFFEIKIWYMRKDLNTDNLKGVMEIMYVLHVGDQ